MQRLVPGWVHRPGQHCASTVLSDLAHFYGSELSEPFCLGLGAGLGFFYLEENSLSPTRTIMSRAHNLEANFFHDLELPFDWKKESDPEQGWQAARQAIDLGRPVLFHADIFYLDHYQSKTHFPLHVILLWGYDLEKGTAYIVDTGWEGLIEIPLASLSRARYSKDSFVKLDGDFFPVALPRKIERLEAKVSKAILLQAELLAGPGPGDSAFEGYSGMRKVAERIFEWPSAPDASWCFRWAYQIIERRGTGGGAFRKLYAGFLAEAGRAWPRFREIAPFEKLEKIGHKWSELAMLLKELSEQSPAAPAGLKKASAWFRELADSEQEFFEQAARKLKAAGG